MVLKEKLYGMLLMELKVYLSSSLQSDLSFKQLNLQTPKRSNMIDERPRY